MSDNTKIKSKNEIKEIIDFIKGKFAPLRVILFGSYAYGTPTADSDIDIMVIKTSDSVLAAGEIRSVVREKFGYAVSMDIVVRDEKYITAHTNEGDFFVSDVIEKGISL